MSSKLESSGPPDEGRRITQVAGPTEVAICEGVGITRIQPTPKSFRVNTGDVVALQARSNTWRTAQIKIKVRVHQHVRRRDAYIRRACVRKKMECESAQSHYTQSAGAVCRVRSAGGEIHTVGCAARYARERPERAHQRSVRVRNDREHDGGSEVGF
jgi:hypothetical protein